MLESVKIEHFHKQLNLGFLWTTNKEGANLGQVFFHFAHIRSGFLGQFRLENLWLEILGQFRKVNLSRAHLSSSGQQKNFSYME